MYSDYHAHSEIQTLVSRFYIASQHALFAPFAIRCHALEG
jgi:hypothetical protein